MPTTERQHQYDTVSSFAGSNLLSNGGQVDFITDTMEDKGNSTQANQLAANSELILTMQAPASGKKTFNAPMKEQQRTSPEIIRGNTRIRNKSYTSCTTDDIDAIGRYM